MGTFIGVLITGVIIYYILAGIKNFMHWKEDRERRKRNEEIERLKETRG